MSIEQVIVNDVFLENTDFWLNKTKYFDEGSRYI